MFGAAFAFTAGLVSAPSEGLVVEPVRPNGKQIVLLAGDEEYRSEEALPQLAKILAKRQGFRCTVLFSINDKGEIDPDQPRNQPGLEALKSADLVIMALRFRQWPDEQMRHFDDYVKRGKPIVALRTSTHAFNHVAGPFERYGASSKTWPGGFGRQILGETWVSHWGNHGKQATRGIAVAQHPILNGVEGVFGTTDVYEAHPPGDAQILMRGEVVDGMSVGSPPAAGRKKTVQGTEQGINDPMMPILWTREVDGRRVVTCTMGAATDFSNEGLRRLVANAVFWGLGMTVPTKSEVGLVGEFQPSPFGFGGFRRGLRPSDLR